MRRLISITRQESDNYEAKQHILPKELPTSCRMNSHHVTRDFYYVYKPRNLYIGASAEKKTPKRAFIFGADKNIS